MEPLRKDKKKVCVWFEGLVKNSELYLLPLSQIISCCQGLLSLMTWKKYSTVKFWLVAISKFISDDLILVSCLVRKVSQDPPVLKEGFLSSVDTQPILHNIQSRQALNPTSYINSLHLFMKCLLLWSLDKYDLGLEFHSVFSVCLCQFTSITCFPGIKYIKRRGTYNVQNLCSN